MSYDQRCIKLCKGKFIIPGIPGTPSFRDIRVFSIVRPIPPFAHFSMTTNNIAEHNAWSELINLYPEIIEEIHQWQCYVDDLKSI